MLKHTSSQGAKLAGTIGAVAQKAGLATSAIRYYEKVGLLPKPERANGRRRYDEAVLGRLRVIRLAQEAGYTISEIQKLLSGFPEDANPSTRWQTLAPAKLGEIEGRIRRLQEMRQIVEQTLACRCESLVQCGEKGCT